MAARVASPSAVRAHLVVGVLVVVVLPLLSWLDGSGQLAWTMFSRTGAYRIELVSDGKAMNPTELAASAAPGPTSSVLAGADHFKHHDVARATLRRHLVDVVALACKLTRGTTIIGRLHERVRSNAPIRTTEVTMQCAR